MNLNTLEEAVSQHSVVSETMQNLAAQAAEWRGRIEQIEAGQAVDRAAALAALMRLLDLGQNLRDAILSEDRTAVWHTRQELEALISRLGDAAAKRQKMIDLAGRLTAGTVTHRRERTREERLSERDAAVSELMERSTQANAPDLPGPEAALWLEWACSLEDSTAGEVLIALNREFPRLDDFVRQLEIEMWHDGHVAAAAAPPAPHTLPAAEPEPEPEPVVAAAFPDILAEPPANEREPVEIPAPIAPPQIVEAFLPEPETVAVSEQPFVAKGFFPADEVECLAIHAARARREPHGPHTVRSLVATSHWLSPWDQNPAFYPGGGIAEDIDYSGKPALAATSPADAEELVLTSSDLQLLTGGADLLRWSLEQADAGQASAVTSLRRLTAEQIRHWFAEIFKIELAEPQVQDMYRLTYGIPLLVSELHRRVVPLHDTPPTWIGYAIWTQVKLAYDAQFPVVAQELLDGPPSLRLTNREIELLKMVAIASDHSTSKTLAANLTDSWHTLGHPEFAPVSSADEVSLRVLSMLGLLPVTGSSLSRPIDALAVIDEEDPIRKIANLL